MSPEAPTQAPSRRRELAMWLGGLSAVAAVLVGTVVAMGGRIEAATWGLVVAAAAMVFALHSLYRMAGVLSRPAVEVVLEQDDVAQLAGVRELREERRRVLRAINELQFDYEMGKLSDEDYQAVRQGYQLRAVEVMRALDAGPDLHPALQDELDRRGLKAGAGAAKAAGEGDSDEDSSEAKAAGEGDSDEDSSEAKASDSSDSDEDSSEAKVSDSSDSDEDSSEAKAADSSESDDEDSGEPDEDDDADSTDGEEKDA